MKDKYNPDEEFTAMEMDHFEASIQDGAPPGGLSAPLEALWWDRKGDWARAHALVDDLESREGMAVHAYLHRKEGEQWNADYWYRRAGRSYHRTTLAEEWTALVEGALANRDSNPNSSVLNQSS